MNLDEHITLWNHAAVKIFDIRHNVMNPGELLEAYLLPASGFLYGIRGSASLKLDGMVHEVRQFHVLHGGKGMRLDIAVKEEFEYYLLFYRAVHALPGRKKLAQLMEQNRPFSLQYGFKPQEPLSLLRYLEGMEKAWMHAGDLARFQVKGLFYQFVHELLWQLDSQGVKTHKPDLVSQAIRYIEQHYQESMSLDSIAEQLNYSPRHLSMRFKAQTGASPIDYLIQIRLSRAEELLLRTDAALRDIAAEVGYSDVYYFSRLFKKHTSLSPVRFRTMGRQRGLAEDRPFILSGLSIGTGRRPRYIVSGDDDNHYQLKRGGSIQMKRNSKSSMALALLLTLTLLLSACSAGAGNTAVGGAGSPSGNTGSTSSSTAAGTSTPNNGAANGSGSTSTNAGDNSATEAKTRTVSTINGEIKIPAESRRIIVDLYLGSMIALGITPVGTPELNLKNPYYKEFLEGVENIGEYETISLEKVLELEPDLIITGNDQLYESFSKIAPTVVVPFGELKNAHEEITYFGKALGKEAEAKKWLDEYDRRISSAKERVAKAIPANSEFSIMQYNKKGSLAFGDNFGRGGQAVYTALGLKPPAGKADLLMKDQLVEISEESLPDFAGDYIVITTNERTIEDFKADPVWGSLEAVKKDRIYVWSQDRSWYFDPIATLSQTEELAAWLTGKASN
ncbi:AraC family transcriptional regulator [Paenibacillus eucommiae]|uniref:Iron complex transport system substrate-binding protein n=1 Tax=Paenibacillus eucommiae TaxID=1355755 RepID=A0ABS4J8E7_9BACL|nr:AraC family transcriptional regulator [Paenibacillus eucommiae]MBP1996103.1 iron complex transport system substrate-binding protein [Paenibacillus eucommiae]